MKNNVGLESISFQETVLFKELALTFKDLKEVKVAEIPDHESVSRLSKVVEHHTGLNVSFDFVGELPPHVNVPNLDRNNPLIADIYRPYIKSTDGLTLISKAGNAVQGTVDLKNSKVSGVFTEINVVVCMGANHIAGTRFTENELAAIVLHELGHIFTYFEFIARTVTTNQVLAGLSKVMDGVETQDKKMIALTSAKKALKLEELDLKDISELDKDAISIVYISSSVEKSRSELGYNIYDLTSWEYLSDQFCSRHGAYASLVSALEKFYKGQNNIAFRSFGGYLFVEALKIVMLPILPLFTIILMLYDSASGGQYDLPVARFKRVRDQAIQYLKDTSISKEDKTRVLDDIAAIDSILKGMNERKQLATIIHEFCSKRTRDERTYRKLQQDLEHIAMNDLFVKSAQLSQLS